MKLSNRLTFLIDYYVLLTYCLVLLACFACLGRKMLVPRCLCLDSSSTFLYCDFWMNWKHSVLLFLFLPKSLLVKQLFGESLVLEAYLFQERPFHLTENTSIRQTKLIRITKIYFLSLWLLSVNVR